MVIDELLWFFGQAASLFVWLYPIIYIFNMQHKDALRTQSWAKQNQGAEEHGLLSKTESLISMSETPT